MASPILLADGLGKSFGGKRLFDDAAFQIQAGEKVAIVGPNGAGKSTLLRLLAGREKADHGTLRLNLGNTVTRWFDQHPDIPDGASVADLLGAGDAPPELVAENAELEARIADPALCEAPGYEEVLERFAAVQQKLREATTGKKATGGAVAEALDVAGLDGAQLASSLSGGQKTRLFLARTLDSARPGDLVVLDEPTNHLDIDSIEWLEGWVQAFDGTVLVVAHDRAFLDNVATRVIEVTAGRVTAYDGNYEDYVEARDARVEQAQREHARAQDKLDQAKAVIQQFRQQKRFDGQFASRMKQLEKYKAHLDKSPDPVLEKLGFGLQFDAVEKSGVEVVRAAGLTKSLGNRRVLDGAEFEVRKGARVGFVGRNGAGKSTLLKLLTGRLTKDAGELRSAPGVKGAFFSQEHDDLRLDRTLGGEVLDIRPNLEERDVKALLGRFRFNPDVDMQRTVSTLSGGERQRLMLLKCILRPSNLLVLDEPTNHLDLWARDVVVRALNSYHGTLIVVSHDRYLLDSVTTTTCVVEGGKVHTFPGSFTDTRHLHHRALPAAATTKRYAVRKKFADWSANTKYAAGEEVQFSDAQVQDSMTLRNALAQGWLERLG